MKTIIVHHDNVRRRPSVRGTGNRSCSCGRKKAFYAIRCAVCREKPLRPMTEPEKAYLAGLIDGEGYIGVTKSKTSKSAKGSKRGVSYRLLLGLRMTDTAPLEFARQTTGLGRVVGGKVPVGGKRAAWNWQLWSKQAAALLAELLPYLLVKRAQAAKAIEFQAAMRQPGRFGLSDAEWSFQEQCSREIRERNYG